MITYVAWVLYSLISAFKMLMIIRAICSWIPSVRETGFFQFIHSITEPPLVPIRKLLNNITWIRQFPIDFSFLALYLILQFVSSMLTIYM